MPSNPYAFPGERYEMNGHITYQEGMSLRDYFAGQALGAALAENGSVLADLSAKEAYRAADAMLAARAAIQEGQ